MGKHRYEATLPRAVLGLVVAVALVAAIEPAAMVFDGHDYEGYPVPRLTIFFAFALDIFVISLAILLVVTAVSAGPIWAVLHRRGWQGWWHAVVVGALVGFALMFGRLTWIMLFEPAHWEEKNGTFVPVRGESWHDWLANCEPALAAAGVGAVAGLIIWRIAYRRVIGTPPAEIA